MYDYPISSPILMSFYLFPLQSSAQKISPQLDQYLESIRSEFSGEKALETTAYVADLWRAPSSA